MGRKIRKVPANWNHPKDKNGEHIPLFDGYSERFSDWKIAKEKWSQGFRLQYNGDLEPIGEAYSGMSFEEYDGPCPKKEDYMPDWPNNERTHFCMYEDTSEGTPISPIFETAEELARWLTDSKASYFGNTGADYETWMRVCKGGFGGMILTR
jgi:hypothetical protein